MFFLCCTWTTRSHGIDDIHTHDHIHPAHFGKEKLTCPCSNKSFFTSSPGSLLYWTVEALGPSWSLLPEASLYHQGPLECQVFYLADLHSSNTCTSLVFLPFWVEYHSVICRHYSPQRSQRTCAFRLTVSTHKVAAADQQVKCWLGMFPNSLLSHQTLSSFDSSLFWFPWRRHFWLQVNSLCRLAETFWWFLSSTLRFKIATSRGLNTDTFKLRLMHD